MIDLLKAVGVVMAIYGVHGIYAGRIYSTRYMVWVSRGEKPFSFWTVSASYIFVGLLIVFTIWHRYG